MLKKNSQILKGTPDIPTLHQLLAKCFQQPGEKLQVQWRSQDNHLFVLDVIYSLKERRPNWQLQSERGGRRQIIADYSGHDILLVYKQISTAANNALEGRTDVSGTGAQRDPRAAATDWLEGKQEAAQANPPPSRAGSAAGFWSEDSHPTADITQLDSAGSVAAAIDESPWATQAPPPVQNTAPPPAYTLTQNLKSADQQKQEAPAPLPFPNLDRSQAPSGGGFSWASTVTGDSGGWGQPIPAAKAPSAPTAKPAEARPKSPSPEEEKAAAEAKAARERAEKLLMHPDKGARAVDKGGPAQSKPAAPVDKGPAKKPAAPDKAPPKAAEKSAPPKPAEKPAPPKPAEKPAPPKVPEKPEPPKLAIPTKGDLSTLSVAKLFKELKAASTSGRVDFTDEALSAFAIVEAGKPIEAWFGELKGDFALLEILLWTSGEYSLTTGVNASDRNVKSTPEALVEQNRNIAYLLDELAGEGLTATSTFVPSNPGLSSDDFNTMATPDAPMELDKLARLYIKLDGKKTIAELNELQVLPRPALIQAIHHLYFNSIIDIIDPKEKTKEFVVTPKELDQTAIQAVMTSLRRVDTGLFTHAAFLYFLQEEFFRIYRAKSSMSIIIFEMREVAAVDGLMRRLPLPIDAVADATMRISGCKRHTDVVAHYEQNDFAIILPNTGSGGTKVFANKVIKALTDTPLAGTEGKTLSFAFGSASMPEDFKELSMLLGAAEVTMSYARQRGKQLVLFKEMEL